MASKQTNTNKAIVQAVAEASRATIQAMVVAGTGRTQKAVPKLGRHMLKQPTFNFIANLINPIMARAAKPCNIII